MNNHQGSYLVCIRLIFVLLLNNLRNDNIIEQIFCVNMRRNHNFWWKENIFIDLWIVYNER